MICVFVVNGFVNLLWFFLKFVKCIEFGFEFFFNLLNDVNKGIVVDFLNVLCGFVVKV